ncbi:MAG: hypothetical protein ABEJ97_04615 [Halobellus sp.]
MNKKALRIIAFLGGSLFVLAGGGGGALAVYAVVRGNSPVWLAFGAVGTLLALFGGWLVYLAVVDTDRWAEEGGLDTSGFDAGPGWGGE